MYPINKQRGKNWGNQKELLILKSRPYAGMQELVWLRGVLDELGLRLREPTPFFLDSKSARDLALNPVFHKRSKHIEIKCIKYKFHKFQTKSEQESIIASKKYIDHYTK